MNMQADQSADVGAEPAEASTDNSAQWESLSQEFEQGDAGVVEGDQEIVAPEVAEGVIPADAPPAPVAPAAPTSEVSPAPPASPPAASPSAQAPAAPASPPLTLPPAAPAVPAQPAAQTPATEVPQAQPAQPAFDYQKWRTEQLTALQAQYKLSDEDAAAMITEPEVVLPKIVADLHLKVMENVLTSVQRMVPQMLKQVTSETERETTAKKQFMSINPDLDNPQYEKAIMHFGQTFRSLNPNASPEEAAKAIGALVRAAYGMQAPGVAQPQVQAPAAAPAPYVPVRGGGGGQMPVTPSNQFEAFALELMQEDL